jgi:cytochrome b6
MPTVDSQEIEPEVAKNNTTDRKNNRIVAWIEQRYNLDGVKNFFAHKQVPLHRHSVWYYLGGMTLFFFVIQVMTGMLLLFYYRPSAESAFESVQFIMTEVRFGWLIRSIHSWSANLMVATAFLHLFSVFFMRAYRKPRELTWVSGVFMLFFAMGFGFSGYLLPWNELAFFATKVGTEIVAVIPLVGKALMEFLRGGEDVTGATLTRFFAIHVAILPFLFFMLLAFHVLMVQVQGMSIPPGLEKKTQTMKKMPFFPNFLLRDLLGWIVALGCLVAIAALFPWELGVKADPFASAPAGIRPEWYFVFMFQTLKYIPAKIWLIDGEIVGILSFGLVAVVLILVPFLHKNAEDRKTSRIFAILGILGIIFMLVMTWLSYFGGE